MSEFVAIQNIEAVFAAKRVCPTVTLWNRLEGRPRTHDFDRALKAEVRDPLWMLTKQWQMGEFKGDDAGSPIKAKVHLDTTQITKYQPLGGAVEAFPDDLPLEAEVERRPVPMQAGTQPLSYDLRVLIGRRWLRLISAIEPGLLAKYIAAYPVPSPDPNDTAQVAVTAAPGVWSQMAALAGRAMDGYALYSHLKADPAHRAHDDITLDQPGSAAAIEAQEAGFVAWFERLIRQPEEGEDTAWQPPRLEYAFDVSAPRGAAEQHLVAEEYYQGHLDWYAFNISPSVDGLPDVEPPDGEEAPPEPAVEASHTRSFVPVPIRFDGMPHTRWWAFEDGKTNFGDIDPDTTEVNKLLLMEFALVFANDWFLMPFQVPAGTIAKVRGVSVTDTFGQRTWVEPTGSGADDDWQRWTMYSLETQGGADIPADLSLVVVPSVPKIQESEAVEAVHMVRDEMANMVWGIETVVTAPTGMPIPGRRAGLDARRTISRIEREANPAEPEDEPLENDARIRYRAMTGVPEHWIPFLPVHRPGDTREIQLQRAAMPRIIEESTAPIRKIRPRTQLLRVGRDADPPTAYHVHEEEVPRAGAFITQSFQRTRWYDGEVLVWFGARKTTGRGERSSGLKFDQIRPKRQ
ncbi:MAG: hypothetical protein AAGB10_12535 [Pseudomonadota bacterium]